jgi:signal transduction histidine kinase
VNLALQGRAVWLARLVLAFYAATSLWIVGSDWLRIFAGDGHIVGELTLGSLPGALAGGPLTPSAYVALVVCALALQQLAFFGAAAVLVWRRSNEVIVFVVAVYLLTSRAAEFPPEIVALMPVDPLRGWIELVVVFTWLIMFAWLFFVFPDGRFRPRWTVLPAAIWFVESVYSAWMLFVDGVDTQVADLVATAVVVTSALVSQAYRYFRISDDRQRQQTKWFLGGLGVALLGFTLGDALVRSTGMMSGTLPPREVAIPWLIQTYVTSLTLLCVPVAMTIALLRYQLFDVDVLLRRALVYTGLTIVVIGVYALVVGGLGTLFNTDNVVVSLLATGFIALVFQPVRERLQRGATRLVYGERDEPYTAISRLGQRLETALAPAEILPAIVETVANALRLPYAAIALEGSTGLAIQATTGRRPVDEPFRMPLSYQGKPVGELLLAPRTPGEVFSKSDRRLLDDLARQVGVAARAVRLAEEAHQLTVDLQASRERLVLAREEERRRLRRDLHDGLGPRLAALTLRLETAQDVFAHDARAVSLFADLSTRTADAVGDVRRIVYDLRPPALDELGLSGAVRQAAESYSPHDMHIAVAVEDDLSGLPAAVEVAAYRIATEALTNAVRHASAHTCALRITRIVDSLSVVVEDDGVGITATNPRGLGLQSMRERAAELGGSFEVRTPPGGGTRIEAMLPLRAAYD